MYTLKSNQDRVRWQTCLPNHSAEIKEKGGELVLLHASIISIVPTDDYRGSEACSRPEQVESVFKKGRLLVMDRIVSMAKG